MRVLVIEDEPQLSQHITKALRRHDHEPMRLPVLCVIFVREDKTARIITADGNRRAAGRRIDGELNKPAALSSLIFTGEAATNPQSKATPRATATETPAP